MDEAVLKRIIHRNREGRFITVIPENTVFIVRNKNISEKSQRVR